MPSYSVYSVIASTDVPIDLSPLFLTPGVADSSLQNLGWQLSFQDEGGAHWSGEVNPDGSLSQGSAPSDFIFSSAVSCNSVLQVAIPFAPPASRPVCSTDGSGQQSGPASPQTIHSVELATGSFVFEQDILSMAGLGKQGWSFALNYQSNLSIEGILGRNFGYPQYMHLEQLTGSNDFFNDVMLTGNQLGRTIFENSSGTAIPIIFSTPAGNTTRGTLRVFNEFSTTEYYTFTASDGTVTTFFGFDYYYRFGSDVNVSSPAPGQIKSIVDPAGNSQTYHWGNTSSHIDEHGDTIYDGVPQLLGITDSYGRMVNYSYYGSDGGYRLQEITDYLGRKINFQYDEDDRVIAVVTPSVLKAAPGNSFPGGTAYVFQYDTDNANPARRDDLIGIWYPNQTQPYLDVETRTVNVGAVYGGATPRYQITYGQNINDLNSYGKVLTETLGDPIDGSGGTSTYAYVTDGLPDNIIDTSSDGTIVSRTIHTDRNGNCTIYDFNAYATVSRMEVRLNRNKNSLELDELTADRETGYVTWTKYNADNQPLLIIYPEYNSVEYTYETGIIEHIAFPYVARRGLLLSETRYPANSLSPRYPDSHVPTRPGSNGQELLTKKYFYEPIFNQLCAVIEERGNPIDTSGTYFAPQNGGDASAARYATLYTFDYQKDLSGTISDDAELLELLGLTSPAQIGYLISAVNTQMVAAGLSDGFQTGLGDINGDGTGDGDGSGLPGASHLGHAVRITHPAVLQVDGTTQERIELFTVNLRGQITTATDPEGNLTVTTRYPENDPEGTGQYIDPSLSTQQYGLVREIHRDADPIDVMNLVGASGDLLTFVTGIIPRTNTPDVFQDLVTRYEGSSGCATCAYDTMGNVLSETDPRGFTTTYDRNELGEVYRVTSPAPYSFRVETSYDANRNVIQVDTEDWQVQYNSPDPTASNYGTFTPSGSGTTAHVPMIPGPGGALRPGWFSNLMSYDILDNKTQDDIDATGSNPANLITQYHYDANQNLVMIIKPEGNTVEYDYDERDLRIAERVGYNPAIGQPGAVTAYSYDGNRNMVNVIGPVDHNGSPGSASETSQTVYITNAFGLGSRLGIIGDWVLNNTYDGFNRVITATNAVGGTSVLTYDPTSTLIQKQINGTIGGASPTDRTGTHNTELANSVMRYDEALRLYEEHKDVFLAAGVFLWSDRTVTHAGGGLADNSTANDHLPPTVPAAALTGGEQSYVLTRNIYDRSGRVVAVLADNTARTSYAWDGAGRQILVTDPLNNTVATQFDGKSNPTQVTRTEVCTITHPAVTDEIFISFTWFDCLNRPVVAGTQGADASLTSNLNLCCPWQGLPATLFSLTGYDSRGNKVTTTDPKLNVIVSIYDGASRLTETQQQMRMNGDGRNAPAANQTFLTANGGIIRTEYVYDGNSRLGELVDDRGASTVYLYDALDRLLTKILPDGSVSTRVYDAANCLTGYTDENGSIFTNTFDALSRKTAVAIFQPPATGVGGTTTQSFQYDGLSRNTRAVDSVSGTDSIIIFVYDSIDRIIEETQNFDDIRWNTTHSQFISLPATQIAYPSALDVFANNTFDLLYRRISVTGVSSDYDFSETVDWNFFGPTRVVETNYSTGSPLIATQMNNARTSSAVQSGVPLPAWGDISSDRLGYDGAGRMITKRYLTGGIDDDTYAYVNSSALAGYTTACDRSGNKLYERHLEAESRSHLYQPFNLDGSFGTGYDSANRLLQYQRGVLSGASIPYRVNPGASITTPTTLPAANQLQSYGLDGLGNWKTNKYTEVNTGGSTTITAENRQHNYTNQITSIQDNTGGTLTTTPFSYDHGNNGTGSAQGNGNLTNDGTRSYQYDAFNRLIAIYFAGTTTNPIVTYVYDALNRRIQKNIAPPTEGASFGGLTGDIPVGKTFYIYDGDQIVMEGDPTYPAFWGKVNFWGQYIDELLFIAVSAEIPPATVYRVVSDLLYRSSALVTTSNDIIETYDTDAYGNTLCYNGPGTDEFWFTDDDVRTNNPVNTTIFTGRQYDPESQLYYYRARYYSPTIGRFISRDPIGTKGGMNIYGYVLNNAPNNIDPSGLMAALKIASDLIKQAKACWSIAGAAKPCYTALKKIPSGNCALAAQFAAKGAQLYNEFETMRSEHLNDAWDYNEQAGAPGGGILDSPVTEGEAYDLAAKEFSEKYEKELSALQSCVLCGKECKDFYNDIKTCMELVATIAK